VRIVRISVVATALVVCAAVAQASDPFYSSLLTRGIADAQRGDYFRAVKELRIAAFGMVNEPSQYLRAQVYLANALEHLGQHAEAATAVDKASKAERINGNYAAIAIDPDTRSAFEVLAAKSLRPEQLAMVPAFRRGPAPAPAPTPAPVQQKPVAVTAPTPKPAPPKPAPPVEKPVAQTQVVQTPVVQTVVQKPVEQKPVITQAVVVQKPVVTQPPPPAPKPAPVAEKPIVIERPQVVESPLVAASKHQPSQSPAASDATFQISEAQRLLNEGKILAARQIYIRLEQSEGLARTTWLDVAKGLNQTSAWRESSIAYQKAMPFRSGEEMHQFYEAVNRYELGDTATARDLFARALPSLPVTRETSLYKAKILGMQ